MWFATLLIGLAFSGGVLSHIRDDLEACANTYGVERLQGFVEMEETPEFETVCSIVLGFMDCLDKAVKKETGFSMEDLQQLSGESEIGKGAKIFNNVRSIFTDICTDGTDLNIAYKSSSECLDSMDFNQEDLESCHSQSRIAYDAFRGIDNYIENEDEDEDINSIEDENESHVENEFDENYYKNRECLTFAFTSACIGAHLHDQCGQSAFDLFQTMIKRSGIVREVLCSEDDIQELKTDFLDSLDHLENQHTDLFRLAFDLRKRRK